MNWNRLIAASIIWAAASALAQAQELTCPTSLEPELSAGSTSSSFKFRYVSFFDGDPSEMVDLAPDDGTNPKVLEQRWQFARTSERPVIMVCRYHGTDQIVTKEVPTEVKECRLSGFVDDQGEIVGSPSLECR